MRVPVDDQQAMSVYVAEGAEVLCRLCETGRATGAFNPATPIAGRLRKPRVDGSGNLGYGALRV
jgi:hypothetical protein